MKSTWGNGRENADTLSKVGQRNRLNMFTEAKDTASECNT